MASLGKHLAGREGRDFQPGSVRLSGAGLGGAGPTEMREAFLRREPSQGGLVWPPAQHSEAHPTRLAPSAKKKEKETAEE